MILDIHTGYVFKSIERECTSTVTVVFFDRRITIDEDCIDHTDIGAIVFGID